MQDEVFRSSISGVHGKSDVGVCPVQWANIEEQFSVPKIISTTKKYGLIWLNLIHISVSKSQNQRPFSRNGISWLHFFNAFKNQVQDLKKIKERNLLSAVQLPSVRQF